MIAATGLLSFISRRNLGRGHVACAAARGARGGELKLRRQFALIHRKDSYLSPVVLRFMDLLRTRGQSLFAKG